MERMEEQLVNDNGELQISMPAPGVLITRFRGRLLDGEHGVRIIEATKQVCSSWEKPYVFHDWERMESFVPEVRDSLAKVALLLLPRLQRVTVLTGEGIPRIGTLLASMLTGNRLTVAPNRKEFDEALAKAVVEHKARPPAPAPAGSRKA